MEPETNSQLSTQIYHKSKKQKKGKSKNLVTIDAQDICTIFTMNSKDCSKIMDQLIAINIKNVSLKQSEALAIQIQKSIEIVYPQIFKLLNLQKNSQQYSQRQINDNIGQFIQKFRYIFRTLKDSQFPAPVADTFIKVFVKIMKQIINITKIKQDQILQMWIDVPIRNFSYYISQLQLKHKFNQQDPTMFQKILVNLLNDLKISQCCTYYASYNPNLIEFQQKMLLPKIINSDQIITPPIISLLKQKRDLMQKVIKGIDVGKAVVLLEHLQEDPLSYEKVKYYVIRKHYLSMKRQYKNWYIFEDKMSFDQEFIKMYCQQAENMITKQKQVKNQYNLPLDIDIINSMRHRNHLIQQIQKIIDNPLYSQDFFGTAETIIHTQQKEQKIVYVALSDFHILEENVIFINNDDNQQFDEMAQQILNQSRIGFDAENRCTSTKYEQQGVSLLQISTPKNIFIIDFLALQKKDKFQKFFRQFLQNPNLLKIGHTVNSDIRYLQKTYKIEQINSFVDIATIFKSKFPAQIHNSLAYMTEKLIGKKLSKFQQRSNWNRRPLKKTQIHYAALDAKICEILYQILNRKQIQVFETSIKNNKNRNKEQQIIRKERLSYSRKYEQILFDTKPKFMIDNMLKKLCSTMRNLGIDAQYVSVSNYEFTKAICEKERRIFITRDTKLLKKSVITIPIYCLQSKKDSEQMFEQIKQVFKIDLDNFKTLSRCVKCNGQQLEVISKQQAMKVLVFHYQDNQIQQFWRCQKCKQIYWEGNQFKNAKSKFQSMK